MNQEKDKPISSKEAEKIFIDRLARIFLMQIESENETNKENNQTTSTRSLAG